MTTGDAHWIRLALQGSEEGYRHLVELYQRPVFSIVVRMVRDAGLAEDLTQETFVKAFRALGQFDLERKFSSWLFTIAHNTTIDHLRRKRLQTVSLDAGEDESGGVPAGFDPVATSEETSPGDRFTRSELGRALEAALGTLRPEYAEILMLRLEQGRSYEEIAEISGLPLGTVKTHLFRARKALARALSEAGWDPGAKGMERLR